MSTVGNIAGRGFWLRTRAMLIKEFIQLKRDRMSFGMIIMIPLMQLVLFGYAINTTPRNLPTAVLLQENSDVGRSILAALENTKYFAITRQRARYCRVRSPAGIGHGVVRDRDPGEFRACAAPRRPARATDRGRCDRPGRGWLCAWRTLPDRHYGAAQRSRHSRCHGTAVRGPRARTL